MLCCGTLVRYCIAVFTRSDFLLMAWFFDGLFFGIIFWRIFVRLNSYIAQSDDTDTLIKRAHCNWVRSGQISFYMDAYLPG
ncbi:hypothetical Protein YC6258_02066 [Gynuella sunshinyii YC6258]|uniref:Uncharacterized protein n=1 Tax=Gynuella sunshinyii YC6258 TaxID=1445510 RepID=A0A0C5V3M9_9GAMM|nr:hypothetical Protein YC6258_02066 [Gynuella sunshinyii YC6258]